MMDDTLPDETRLLRDALNRFMATEVAPVMEDYERRGEFPREQVRKAGAAGFFGAVFPASVGGADMGFVASAVITEELARNDVRFAACYNQQASTCPYCIFTAGTPAQIQQYVPPLLAGEAIGMMALTEPGGGSDALGNLKTHARRDGHVYRLTGSKMFASLANETDTGVLLARTERDDPRSATAFIVEPKKYPGFEARPIDMHGLSKALRTNAVFLDDFIVPVENRLGAEGDGFAIVMQALQAGRITVAAKALGVARACFEDAVAYANQRQVRGPAGRPLSDDPVRHRRHGRRHRSVPRAGVRCGAADGRAIADQPHRRDCQIPRLANRQALRRLRTAGVWRLRPGKGDADFLVEILRRSVLHRRGHGERPEDPDCRGRAWLQDRRPAPRPNPLPQPPDRSANDGNRRVEQGSSGGLTGPSTNDRIDLDRDERCSLTIYTAFPRKAST